MSYEKLKQKENDQSENLIIKELNDELSKLKSE